MGELWKGVGVAHWSTQSSGPVTPEINPGSRTPRRELVQEALEVVGVECWWAGAAVAVGVGVAGGELGEETLEVVGGEEGRGGGLVAVGVARAGPLGDSAGDQGARFAE